MAHSTVLRGGIFFDGTGREGTRQDLLLQDGKVASIGLDIKPPEGSEVIDVSGQWVMPGFIDLHTHYDAEVELAPALSESVRHGVTTVLLGSCGLSMAVGEPSDLADMFCRVEGIPREDVLQTLEEVKDWHDPAGYLAHMEAQPLGPNVTMLLGHSTIRAAAMGLERSLSADVTPTEQELQRMEQLLQQALDVGYLGLSVNTLPWDKMDGDRFRSRPTPSVFAGWSEYRRLFRALRRRDAILQAVPNIETRVNVPLFLLASTGLFRRALRTTLIALMDPKSDRMVARLAGWLTRICNKFLRGKLRWQALPNPFDLYTDGLEVPIIEEIGAGTLALHEIDPDKRSALLRDPEFRATFRRQWRSWFPGRAYHRDLAQTRVVDCPDKSLIGQSFAEIAASRNQHPVDGFLDLQAEYGNALRWYTVVANDRPHVLSWILRSPDILIGFSDAGAHLRNMAFYNFGLRFLHRVRQAEQAQQPLMSMGRAVHRLTGEIADWLGIDAGTLAEGKRADIVVLDPQGLNAQVEQPTEAPMPCFQGMSRMVCRNDRAVSHVFVRGRKAWTGNDIAPHFGQEQGFGQVLRAQHTLSR